MWPCGRYELGWRNVAMLLPAIFRSANDWFCPAESRAASSKLDIRQTSNQLGSVVFNLNHDCSYSARRTSETERFTRFSKRHIKLEISWKSRDGKLDSDGLPLSVLLPRPHGRGPRHGGGGLRRRPAVDGLSRGRHRRGRIQRAPLRLRGAMVVFQWGDGRFRRKQTLKWKQKIRMNTRYVVWLNDLNVFFLHLRFK